MTWAQIAYFSVGMAFGGIIADLGIGWWAVLVAVCLGFLIGVMTTLWKRRFA